MRVGCGLRVRRIDGNEYLYFWHYEREGGRSERREDYVGPVREAKSRQEAARKLLAFHRRVQQDLGARIARPERTTRGHRERGRARRKLTSEQRQKPELGRMPRSEERRGGKEGRTSVRRVR